MLRRFLVVGTFSALSLAFSCNTPVQSLPPSPASFLDGSWLVLFEDGHTDCLTIAGGLVTEIFSNCQGSNALGSTSAIQVMGDLVTFTTTGQAQDGSTTQTAATLRVINNNLLDGSILRVRADGSQATLDVTLNRQ